MHEGVGPHENANKFFRSSFWLQLTKRPVLLVELLNPRAYKSNLRMGLQIIHLMFKPFGDRPIVSIKPRKERRPRAGYPTIKRRNETECLLPNNADPIIAVREILQKFVASYRLSHHQLRKAQDRIGSAKARTRWPRESTDRHYEPA
jgi:hypothetical protein